LRSENRSTIDFETEERRCLIRCSK